MKQQLRILVFGGRDYTDEKTAFAALDTLHRTRGVVLVIQGGATGADRLGAKWAELRGIPSQTVDADWKKHGRAAGPIRNTAMLKLNPDGGVGFPGGKGTDDMSRQCNAAGVTVWWPAGK